MELLLRDGDYVPDVLGGFETCSGLNETLARAVFRIAARRGAFPLLPGLGSRLYKLPGRKSCERQSAAEQYISEALADEDGVTVSEVTLSETGDTVNVSVRLEAGGETAALDLIF